METHRKLMLVAKGDKTSNCEWMHVENKQTDIVQRVLDYAGPKCKTFMTLIERENGWLTMDKKGEKYFYEVIEETEIDLNVSMEGWKEYNERS